MSSPLERPTPKKLLSEAKQERHQHPFDLSKYGAVIDTLFQKEFSYAKIAKWLSARLGGKIDRGQIYYIYQNFLKKRRDEKFKADFKELQDQGLMGNDMSDTPEPDPQLDQFLADSESRHLIAQADNEDGQRTRRKKP
jgi:hypothetical protein